jgi:HD-like signal output (HDOD) protein
MSVATNDGTVDTDDLRGVVRATLTRVSQTGMLPSLPGVATTALSIARDPDGDVDELTQVMQSDVGISARVLRVANSPGTGRMRQTRSLQDAVVTIGLRQTCDILVALCAKDLYSAPGPYTEVLWNHALAVAVAGEELGQLTKRLKKGRVFLPGLFHDVGRVAFQLADPGSFATLQELVDSGEGRSTVFEREWYQFDHAQAGSILAEDWGLAPEQCDAIRWHHDPSKAGVGRDLAAVLNAADWLAYHIGFGTNAEPPDDISLKPLGLSKSDLPALEERIREAFEVQRQLIS